MIKKINFKRIIVVGIILLIINFVVALFLSPRATTFLVAKLNKYSKAKITVEKVTFWPLTLSLSIKNLKIFDPDNPNERIVSVPRAVLRLSPLGVLSKRLVFSRVSMQDAYVTVYGEPDGSFNIQKLTKAKASKEPTRPVISLPEDIIKKKDWFARVQAILKDKFSKKNIEKESKKQPREVTKTVEELARGKRVHFKRHRDNYLFEISSIAIYNAVVELKPEYEKAIEIRNVGIKIKGLSFDPQYGINLGSLAIKGRLKNQEGITGRLYFIFKKRGLGASQKTDFGITLKDVDVNMIRFIYRDSLPVLLQRGFLSLKSETTFIADNLHSKNTVTLRQHDFRPKPSEDFSGKFVPIQLVCERLNIVDPLALNFNITGSADKPKINGLQESIKALIRPTVVDIKEKIKKEGLSLIDGFFKKKGEETNQTNAP